MQNLQTTMSKTIKLTIWEQQYT